MRQIGCIKTSTKYIKHWQNVFLESALLRKCLHYLVGKQRSLASQNAEFAFYNCDFMWGSPTDLF